ncbi:MAG: S8 family serine peptidase [Clostridia bacterium]|nr:S8 family serine peptidase [Clostridia bacterium]
MNKRFIKQITAILLSVMLIISCIPLAFAAKPIDVSEQDPDVYLAKNAETFLKAAQKMLEQSRMFVLPDENSGEDVDLNDLYQTGRIMVRPGATLAKGFIEAAADVIYFNGWYFLQYGTEKATKIAYEALKEAYGASNVILDTVFQVQLPKAVEVKKLKDTPEYMSWGIKNMGMDKVQQKLERKKNKPQVKVAILDTGISYLETAFNGRIVNAADLIAFTPIPHDFNGHGTHCASTIVDATPSNVKVMPVKTMTGLGFGTIFNNLMGLVYAQLMDADIVNMSLAGLDELELKPYDQLLKSMVDNGMTIVVAAGNEGTNVKKSYPSSSEYVITVGAIGKNNRVDKEYSNFGSAIDFVAPGTGVKGLSTELGIPAIATMTGTSMAAPHVSAACALIKTVHPNYNQKQIYNVLKANAVDIEAKGKDKYAGWGRIDLTNFAKQL